MIKSLPNDLPIFPLAGVMLLPRGQLPLNIFEPRYLAMVDDALKSDRMIGMIQPRGGDGDTLYRIGCGGRITSFAETDDGRYLITLTGVSRFSIDEELPQVSGYRRVRPDWSGFERDCGPETCIDLDRAALKDVLKEYFGREGMACDWEAIDSAPDSKLMTCLAMVCPFEPKEKQALLETVCCRERAQKFVTMLKMAVHDKGECGGCH